MITTRVQAVKIIFNFYVKSRGEVSGHAMKIYGRMGVKLH
jgi:hypothetical protein